MEIKQPHNEHELELAIVRRAGNSNARAVSDRMVMANAIVGQLLGEGVAVKGGSSMLLRYGSENARFTEDFDTTRRIDLDVFLKGLRKRLEDGWCGFTGTLDILPQANPHGVLFDYVMQPIRVRLSYRGKSWCSVNMEMTLGSAGCADSFDTIEPNEETVSIFRDLGFPLPGPVYVMKLDHQVAQKLRGASCDGSDRAHDLVDLQLILQREDIYLPRVKKICQLIFRGKRCPPWPPSIKKGEKWDSIYDEAKLDLPVLSTVDEAIRWVNDLVAKIDRSE